MDWLKKCLQAIKQMFPRIFFHEAFCRTEAVWAQLVRFESMSKIPLPLFQQKVDTRATARNYAMRFVVSKNDERCAEVVKEFLLRIGDIGESSIETEANRIMNGIGLTKAKARDLRRLRSNFKKTNRQINAVSPVIIERLERAYQLMKLVPAMSEVGYDVFLTEYAVACSSYAPPLTSVKEGDGAIKKALSILFVQYKVDHATTYAENIVKKLGVAKATKAEQLRELGKKRAVQIMVFFGFVIELIFLGLCVYFMPQSFSARMILLAINLIAFFALMMVTSTLFKEKRMPIVVAFAVFEYALVISIKLLK